jgi:hypothetical protein
MTMKPTVFLAIVLMFALSPHASAKPLKVFILAGQSNMEGHAAISTFDYIGKDPLTAPEAPVTFMGDEKGVDDAYANAYGQGTA